MKIRSQEELAYIQSSWSITDEGVLVWKRCAGGRKNIGDPVGLSTLSSGHTNCSLSINGKFAGYSTGQIAWFLYTGLWPIAEIDHVNGNPQDNRQDNLRLASRSEQCMNRVAGRKGRKNKGVYKREYGNKWSAQIWIHGECKSLGTYNSEEDAIRARKVATDQWHGRFANGQSYVI